jgi:hypothetical protein
MASLTEMFHTYLADLFPQEAEFTDDGAQKLKIIYPIPETVPGQRYSRPVVLNFEQNVVAEFQAALDSGNVPRQDRIGDSLCEIVSGSLVQYDVHEHRDSAFKIYVDSRATDL